ncbi:MAG: acetate--CoA ligase family protein, partial [Nanoarchaeota archaeon]|nr:acetate--CoA ligase family protein [Nanoarchaeota archaeon]
MKVLSEKRSEDFLEEGGFEVVPRDLCITRFGLRRSLKKIGFPFVLKAVGRKIKTDERGLIKSDVRTYTQAIYDLKNLKKIRGVEGILVQKKFLGKEFFVSVKKDRNSRPFLSFSSLYPNEHNEKGISSKALPITRPKIKKIFSEAKLSKNVSGRERKSIEEVLTKVSGFVKKHK